MTSYQEVGGEGASSSMQISENAAIVKAGQSLEDFQRAFWAHQIKVVESDDMDSLLVRVGMSSGPDTSGSSIHHFRDGSVSPPLLSTSPTATAAEATGRGEGSGHAAQTATPRLEPFPIPLARIKKVIKSDSEVSMVSSEAPVLLARACEILIADLTSRAFLVADSNKRRTIQRSDVRDAIAQTDVFDFAIDVLPRDQSASPQDQTTGSI